MVVQLALRDILTEGLPFDRCDEVLTLVAPRDDAERRALALLRGTQNVTCSTEKSSAN